jgi:hypothetical protein
VFIFYEHIIFVNAMAREFAIATVTSWPPTFYLKVEVPSVRSELFAAADVPVEMFGRGSSIINSRQQHCPEIRTHQDGQRRIFRSIAH